MYGQPMPSITVNDLAAMIAVDASTPLFDVREPAEYAAGHVASAVLMPMSVVPVRAEEIARDRTAFVICHSGGRSGQAVAWLNEQGFDTVNVEGGTAAWITSGHPVA